MNPFVIFMLVIGLIAFCVLIWAEVQQRKEDRRRTAGQTTLQIESAGCLVACLGLAVSQAIIAIIVWATLGRDFSALEQMFSKNMQIGIMVLVALLLLAIFAGIPLYAMSRFTVVFVRQQVVINEKSIRYMKAGKVEIEINWNEPWRLTKQRNITHMRRNSADAIGWYNYFLIYVLEQDDKRLAFFFDSTKKETESLAECEFHEEALEIQEKKDWFKQRITDQYAAR